MATVIDKSNRQQAIDDHYSFVARTIRNGVFVAMAILAMVAIHISNTRNLYKCEPITVIVQHGDTLDEIARRYCDGEVTSAVDHLASKYGVVIYPTQAITLPKDNHEARRDTERPLGERQ